MTMYPGYRASALIDKGASSLVLPALPGSSASMPKNYNIPTLITGNNIYQFIAVEGLQFPVLNLNLAVLGGTGEGAWFSATELNSWLTRTNDDVASIGALKIWDAYQGFSAATCKHADFSLGGSQGELVRCSARFWGAGAVTAIAPGAAPNNKIISGSPASFQHAWFSSSGIVSWDLSWSNNLMPNPSLPTSESANNVYPSEINAGMYTARLRLVMLPDATPPADGAAFTVSVKPPNAAAAVVFTCNNPLRLDPQERTFQMPRALREYNYVLLGKDASATTWTAPITIA